MTEMTASEPNAELVLGQADFPATCIAAEDQASRAQHRFVQLTAALLLLPLGGVVIGAVASVDEDLAVFGVIAAVLAAVGAALRAVQRSSQVERIWYEARAAAEEMKGLAWRYAVRAKPFDPPDQIDEDADELFITEITRITADRDFLDPPSASGEITPAMRKLRGAPLSARRAAYLAGRVVDQLSWYSSRARRFAALADRFDVGFLVLTGITIVAGVVLAANSDLVKGISPTLAFTAGATGAVFGWAGVRRYSSLSRSYREVASELSMRNALAVHRDTPEEWVAFVDDVESVIEREHAQWRAARR